MGMLSRLPATLVILLHAMTAAAGQPLFDSHLHYNADDADRFAPGDIVAILRANDVRRALITGSPPEQALRLYRAAPELIVPFLGVYRTHADRQGWTEDAGLPARVRQQLSDGPWRGVGELHLFTAQRHSPVFLRIVELAAQRGVPLLMHCDPPVIDSLFEHRADALVIWAHAGAYPYPQLLRDYLDRYPRLYVDLSVRDERIAPGGELDPQWEALLWEYSSRFMVGVDTYSVERWSEYGRVAMRIRGWLAQLPEDTAARIGYGNAAGLFTGVPR